MIKKVLVVDDDESILDAIALILEEEGYLVETTLKGEEIYEIIKTFQPDLILIDVLLSGRDGRDICKIIKKDPLMKRIPVILISAHPHAEKSVSECGADGFLAKPFDTQDLLAIVATNTLE